MNFSLANIAKYRQIIGIAVAALVLTIIFVPFQKASAFTLTTSLPDATSNTTTKSASGEKFTVAIDIQPGELLSISSIDTVIDNGQSSVAKTTFTISGTTASYSSGTRGIIKDNTLTLTLPSSSQYGYAYGYGFVSNGITGPTGYSYAIPYSYAFIGGNTGGYANAVGNNLLGYVGPGTITITGYVNTGLMSTGSGHTLDVVVNTGSGANPDKLVSPTLTFTVNANSQVTSATVSSGSSVSTSAAAPSGGTITIQFSNVASGGQIPIEEKSASSLDAITPTIFNSVGTLQSTFTIGGSTGNTAGKIYEIDLSAVSFTGTFDVTIPYDPSLLPSGVSESDVKFYHWTGTAWEDKTISVDTTANTVTGRLSSLSPVVAGYISPTTSTTTTTVGGGGGGGSVIINQTLPPSYFDLNPLAKIQLQSKSLKDMAGNPILGAKIGQQININASFKNLQQVSQDYAMIVQIIDQNGYTTDLGWITGNVESGKTVDGSRSWTVDESGSYTIKIYVWNGVSGSPIALSEVTQQSLTATA